MPDDLEQQLTAFGQTLEERTREPISAAGDRAPAPKSRRGWAVLGAAACLIAVLAGLIIVTRDGPSRQAQPAPTTDGSDTSTDWMETALSAPDVPFDPLGLDGAGWELRSRNIHPYGVIDVMGCAERGEYDALVGHQVVRDLYQRNGSPWAELIHVRYGDRSAGVERLWNAIDLNRCDGLVAESYEQLDLGDHGDIWIEGYRLNDSFRLAVVGEGGEAVLVSAYNDAASTTVEGLVGSAVAYVQRAAAGELVTPDPGATTTQLDDLAAVVGDDPLGLLAEGWTSIGWGVGPFQPEAWPVCGPAAVVESAAGAPMLTVSYRSPGGQDFGHASFLLEHSSERRAQIGAAITLPPGCPPESLLPGSGETEFVDGGDDGYWGRGDTFAVAPAGIGVLPLVALVDADLVDRALEFLAPPPMAIPADPLGLERDGWMLVQRDTDPLDFSEVEGLCPAVDFGVSGSEQVHDILTPPDSRGLDLDVQIVRVGSIERGNRLSQALLGVGRCAGESVGIEVRTGAMSSERATWVRVGPDFALVTIVGEGDLTIALEIEGDTFDDDLIGDLVHRAGTFLRTGAPAMPTTEAAFVLAPGPPAIEAQAEPMPGDVQLFVSNQSFEDDPVELTIAIDGRTTISEPFPVEGQHNWLSWYIRELEPGEHTISATSDTGAAFDGTFTVAAAAPTWAVLDYWYYPDDPEGRHFTFGVFDQPVQFA